MEDRPTLFFLTVLFFLVVGILWLAPIRSSLWTDELATYWLVKDGLRAAIDRSVAYQGLPPIYPIVASAALAMFGPSEVGLRLPSVFAMVLAAFLLYRIGARLVDREAGLLAALVFACLPTVAFAASTARTYAFGVLATVAAVLALVRWLDRGRLVDGCAYVLLASLTVYVHWLFGTMLLVHAIVALARRREGGPVGFPALGLAVLSIGILLAPGALQLLSVFRRRHGLSYMRAPYLEDLLVAIVTPSVAAGVALGLVLAWALMARPRPGEGPGSSSISVRSVAAGAATAGTICLIVAWAVVPPLVLYVLSHTTNAKVFVPRYFLCSAPGVALLASHLIWSIEPLAVRRFVAVSVAGIAVMYAVFTSHQPGQPREDWREAIARTREIIATGSAPSETAVLVGASLIEAHDLRWLHDPERRSYLLSPLGFYPLALGEVIPLPFTIHSMGAEAYLERIAASAVETGRRVVLLVRGDRGFEVWLRGRLGSVGFQPARRGAFRGGIWVLELVRTGAGSAAGTAAGSRAARGTEKQTGTGAK